MTCIAVLPYYKVQREVTGLAQEIRSNERSMILYSDKIVTKYREFHIKDVFDMSFRRMGNEGGFFYLHTSTGVYPYMVKIDPKPFIQSYRKITIQKYS
ncbi:hypothetical protein ABEW19_08045 [Paenibacillus illinoisensis]|uniref:hypothetical protein n=1 Tax=Paenibacillus illinoisensis TaxID=59845 RepID=UPI003D2B8937